METKQQIEFTTEASPIHPKADIENRPVSLDESLVKLERYGGMRFVKSLIRETENMDPRKRAAHAIFLTDPIYKETRKRLSKTLDLWIDFLDQEFDNAEQTIDYCTHESQQVERCLSDNLYNVREEIKE